MENDEVENLFLLVVTLLQKIVELKNTLMQRMLNTQKMLNYWWHQIFKKIDNQNIDKQFCK